jgi:flagellar biosynthesis protein FliP
MSMGMVMLPPVFISLPFKILLFVLVDGWNLVTRRSWRASTMNQDTSSASSSAMERRA